MSDNIRTVLITGCSPGSLGGALAMALRKRGLKVYGAARNPDKTGEFESAGIHCLSLDVLDDASIKQCVQHISDSNGGKLDMLVNSVGRGHYQPFMHLDLKKARELFDLNVWGYVAVTQAFLPLLMKAASPVPDGPKSVIVNNTSISSVLKTPYHSAYGASKAAMAAFNDSQRVELEPFGIRVVDLKTGSTESNFQENKSNPLSLPEDSPYKPIEKEIEGVIQGDKTEAYAVNQHEWAMEVVDDLLKDEKNPPPEIWRGGAAGRIRITNALDGAIPTKLGDKGFQDLGGLNKLGKILIEQRKEEERKRQPQ